jgi:hypothetical protein
MIEITDKTTRQELFDYIATFLLKQGRGSLIADSKNVSVTIKGPACAYRGDNGTMCAVGCIMPDDVYRPDLEGSGLIAILAKNMGPWFTAVSVHETLLRSLQGAHDNAAVHSTEKVPFNEHLVHKLRHVALEHRLEYAPERWNAPAV